VGDFITGVRYFGQGFGLLVRRPRLLLIGMLPAILTTVILLGGMAYRRADRRRPGGYPGPPPLLCMIPLLAIVVMPVAFAGGVLVALDVLGLAQGGKLRHAVRQ
jgi:hypothetical protein